MIHRRAILMGLVLLAAAFAIPRSSVAGQNDTAYLQIDGVPGSSTEKVHPGWIELTSWSWSMGEKAPAGAEKGAAGGMEKTGAGARKARAGELKVAMKADAKTRLLEKAVATGQAIPKVVLEVLTTKPNQPGQVFLTIKMEDVIVSSFAMSEGSAEKGVPSARAAFTYAKVEYTYAPQKTDGTKGAASPAEASWDLKTAQKM
jgi:type VI secretion system secreted protein Hcp